MIYDQITDEPFIKEQEQIQEEDVTSKIHVVSRASIPTHSLTPSVRAFIGNETLERFIPTQHPFAIEWIDLLPGEDIVFSLDTKMAVLIVCQGNGRLTGEQPGIIQTGDTVVIPADCEFGCINASTYQLSMLKIIFEPNIYQLDDTVSLEQRITLQDILSYNQQRLEQHVQIPFFKLLEDGTLLDTRKRQIFISCLYVWSNCFQHLIFGRQATCIDKRYQSVFLQHFLEEIGHDKLLEEKQDIIEIKDSILSATAGWFVTRMFMLDNVGKAAIVHLVLETSGDEFHNRAKHVLSSDVSSKYFDLHADLDDGHAEMGMDLLKHQHPITYVRLRQLIEEAWDMFETMMDRIVYLVKHDIA